MYMNVYVNDITQLGTPPLFRAIMAIGCLTRVSHKAGSTANSSDSGNTFALQVYMITGYLTDNGMCKCTDSARHLWLLRFSYHDFTYSIKH
jgi:hypothetical protein